MLLPKFVGDRRRQRERERERNAKQCTVQLSSFRFNITITTKYALTERTHIYVYTNRLICAHELYAVILHLCAQPTRSLTACCSSSRSLTVTAAVNNSKARSQPASRQACMHAVRQVQQCVPGSQPQPAMMLLSLTSALHRLRDSAGTLLKY